MVTYALPADIRGLIFDMDMTLYRHEAYYASQIADQVALLAADRGEDPAALQGRLDAWAEAETLRLGGRKPSFGNTLLGALGYPISASVDLRRRALRPEAYLEADPRLAEVLADLGQRFSLVLVTNNPSDLARRTLKALGVDQAFPSVVGLEGAGHSKPHRAAFDLAYAALGLAPGQVVSIGDRFPVDLETPLALGSGAILVESMDDVYRLPEVLRPNS